VEQERRIVSYLRVSTERSQGANGLGIHAQRATVADFCQRGRFALAKEFVAIESGRNNERTVLAKAVAHARRIGATLLVAKLDRLSRSVRFIATVLDAGVEFRACDVPDASRLLLHILSAVPEAEAAAVSQRTKSALKAARERGTLLGAENPACRNLGDSTARGRAAGQAANQAKAVAAFADVLEDRFEQAMPQRPLKQWLPSGYGNRVATVDESTKEKARFHGLSMVGGQDLNP
jgi:DNA invertase Pin-like site-specific DNA recombinase